MLKTRSLPFKIAGISCALLAAAILVLSILSVRSIQTSSLQAAVLMGRNKLTGDIASFEDVLASRHGKISLVNGDLVDEYGNSIMYNRDIVDHISSLHGVEATILVKEGGAFKRIATSIIDSSGNRPVDTYLETDSAAFKPVSSGEDYFGNVVILGKEYLTAYRPLFAENLREVIGLLFIGIEMSHIIEYIENTRNSNIIVIVIGAIIILIPAALVIAAACHAMLLKPIHSVMDMLKSLRDGDLSQKADVSSNDEIGEMVDDINSTMEKVKSMVVSLEQHGRLLDTANEAAAILLANSGVASFDASLMKCFELLGRCLDADRVQIWRNETIENEPHFVLRYEWLSDYGKNCKSIPNSLHFPYSAKKEWYQKFLNHESINAPVCELPQEDRDFLSPYDIKSIIILPMFLDGDFWGFFSIDDCRLERGFSEKEINVLTSTGLMMTSAVNRNLQALTAREAEERVRMMFDSAPYGASFWDEDLNVIDCNNELVRLFDLSDKQEFIGNFFDFSPEFQPDGSTSKEKAFEFLNVALNKDYSRFEWVHQKMNGEPIPCEVIFVRVKYKGKNNLIAYVRDLREQRAMIAANEKIRETDERRHLMFDAAPLAITMWDPESMTLIDCNMEAVYLTGLKDKKTYIETFAEMTPEYQPNGQKSSEMIVEIFDKAMKDGIYRYKWSQGSVSGEVIPFDITTVRLKDKDGYIAISYAQDMRELYAAMKKIHEANEQILSVLDAAPLAITMWNPVNYEIINCNLKAIHMVGMTDKKVYMETFAQMATEYQANGRKTSEMLVEIFDEAMRNGICRHDWTHKTLDGEVIPFHVNAVRLKFMDEYVIISYAQDMREINAAIEKMRKTDEFTQVIFNAMPLACQLWDKDLQCIMCNDEAVRVYRAKDKEDFLNNFFDFSPEYQPDGRPSKEKGYENIMKALNDGYCRFDWHHIRGDGEEFTGEITIIRAMYGGESALIGYTRDLSDEMTAIKERHKAEIAEASNNAKSDFLAKMSHEIRTPMNVILGVAEIQLEDEKHPPQTKEAFERIYNSGDLLIGIINDILDLSKIEAGKMSLSPLKYDIASLIHDTVQLIIMRYGTKLVKFVLDIKEDMPLFFIGDVLRIKQILNNILSNAFKYTENGTVKMIVYAEPVDQENSNDTFKKTVVFVISDTGQGMTPDQVQELGTKYSRFNTEINRNTEGTGLGMNITRNLVQMMNGSILVESEIGKGSTFTVRLPQDSEDSVVIGEEIADNLMGLNLNNSVKIRNFRIYKEYMPYGRVMIVDDVESNLYVAKGLMSPYGLSIDAVMSGFEAIDKIKDGSSYDIIFMDHMMPKMDGIEAAKIIRGLGYKKPIVALTANAIAGQAAMFIENGFDDFISKPIDIRQLNTALNKFVRDIRSPEEIEELRNEIDRSYFNEKQKKSIEPQLAEIFIRDANKALTELEAIYTNNCRRENDLSILVINVHAMKSALANVGETTLCAEAAELEEAGRKMNTGLILFELPSFMKKLRNITEKLKFVTESGKNTEDDPGGSQYLKEKLLVIKEACGSYNKKTAKKAYAEIKEKTWPQSINEQLDLISGHLLHSEFDEVIKIIIQMNSEQ